MTPIRSAAIIGLGLVGGSLARDLSSRAVRVLAYDRDARSLRAARRRGVVDGELDSSLEGAEEAELVVLAVPVSAMPALLSRLAPRLERTRLIIDVGSTKRTVVAAAEALGIGERFVGCHPLAGSHRSGWSASRTGLFAGARVFLCPTGATRTDTLALARELWGSLGAHPEIIDAELHDRRLAWESHLPQAAATALALVLEAEGVERGVLGPGGRDMTRLAGSSPEMWTAIAMNNALELSPALASLEARIRELRMLLDRQDEDGIGRVFAAGLEWFARDKRRSASRV